MDFNHSGYGVEQYQPQYLAAVDGSIPVDYPGAEVEYVNEPIGVSAHGEYHEPIGVSAHGEYHEVHSVLGDGCGHYGVSTVHFDIQEELLWMGTHQGHVTSYYGPHMQKYTSFQTHATQPIVGMATFEGGVLSLTADSLRCNSRQGMRIFDYKHEAMVNMQSMLLFDPFNLVMGGQNKKLIKLDLTTGENQTIYDIDEEVVSVLRTSQRFLCCGDSRGKVNLRDPATMKVVHSLDAQSGGLTDFDVHGNQLVTCGLTDRLGTMALDRLLIVYDLRVMRPITPLQIPIEPVFLRYVPTYSNRLAVISQSGQFQLLDPGGLVTAESMFLYQINTGGHMVSAVDVSTNFQGIAFGESGGYVHLWSESNNVVFNDYSQETEFAPQVDHLNPIGIMDEFTPLSSIPTPYGESTLLSEAKHSVSYTHLVEIKYSKLGVEDFDFRHYNKTNFAGLETHIPNAYCNAMLQVLYFIEPLRCAMESHICAKEFCLACELGFLFHMLDQTKGKTCQASNFLRAFRTIPEASALGLIIGDAEEAAGRANLPRLIQSWNRFVLPQLMQDTQEIKEDPLTSETDVSSEEVIVTPSTVQRLFESDMDIVNRCKCGKETTRSTSTMLVTLNYPDMNPAGAGQPPKVFSFASVLQGSLSLEHMTQAWCKDCKKYLPTVQTRTIKRLPDVIAINCQLETNSDMMFWRTQEEIAKQNGDEVADTIVSTTKMCRYGKGCTRKDCKFRHSEDDEGINVIKINTSSWVPCGIKMRLSENGALEIHDIDKEEELTKSSDDGFQKYLLHTSVAHIQDLRSGGNLIAHINVGKMYHKRKEGVTHTNWYVFNDFAITPIERHEARQFNLDWMTPCVLYFTRTDLAEHHDTTVHYPIDESVLLHKASLAQSTEVQHSTFTALQSGELQFEDGFPVAIDAEFVSLNQEEAEIRSDGTRTTVKPSQMSVARITCIRGVGPMQGIPFIDDYISTQEQVVDYLTKFSGIKPGDLDVMISSKHITTLKSTYLKLRYLVDRGVTFIGHGLKKDFRVINLQVPSNQIMDTAILFSLPKQRLSSLKFLAWYFLKLNIQSETHDSIEDARTALLLYQKYLEGSDNGNDKVSWKATLKELYEQGRKLNWKIPEPDASQ
ncbi:PAN2-PAN3 deadenylation complex catalytic subunit PAN2-like [Anneissia japonica]|uniref:PAN2-PAN3 deadenylation complex catalytic subunit PAN2-like n=1 Tax=Anneissia japonica TaxID=1529436 RepID=UPI00142591A0|nr:PAN2-PAN3 deadenylation complex catalytic subunit PAN2-like [Anneissia japonica]